MGRETKVLVAALVRPINVTPLGLGLLFALTGHWWLFPLALVPYAMMVLLSIRNPDFVRAALRQGDDGGQSAIGWEKVLGALHDDNLKTLLGRIRTSEKRVIEEVASAQESLRPVLLTCLVQLRSAAQLGVTLATRLEALKKSLEKLDPAELRTQAGHRREWAKKATDGQAREEFMKAAEALEEGARSAEALLRLKERTFAQLDNLASSLETAALRSVRVRVDTSGEGSASALADALRADVESMQSTLSAFEETDTTHEALRRE